MSSNAENQDVEVKRANTRNRSKRKQNAVDASENQDQVHKPVNGTKRHKRGKRSNKKNVSQNESHPKRVKKDISTSDESKEQSNDEEESDVKKKKEPSKRQVKREKAEQRESMKKEASKLEAIEKALNYVSKWKHARSEWKFEKLRQIWLMDNLLDDSMIPDDIFPTVLEYFEGCKGIAREQLLKKGMDVIKKQEENDETLTEDEKNSVVYRRARQLLQALPTET